MIFKPYDPIHAITIDGIVKDDIGNILEPYVSTNGLVYQQYTFEHNGYTCLKRLDIILARCFIPVPKELSGLPLTVSHIDGNLTNINIENLEWVEDIEQWKTCDYLKGYYVSSWGRILSPYNGIIKGTSRDGYIMLTINNDPGNSIRVGYFVHRIVADLFLDGDIVNKDINHIDGIKDNPRWDNLEIVTRYQNNHHAIITGLRKIVSTPDVKQRIDELLILYDGSIMKVVYQMKDEGYENITENIVSMRKRHLVANGITFTVKFVRKFNEKSLILVKELIIKYNGNSKKVYEEIHDKFPDITIQNIKSVRDSMKKNGHDFINFKYNIKITEDQRLRLLKLLKENDSSPSKTYHEICKIDEFKNVTIYDLKYLKRKYLR